MPDITDMIRIYELPLKLTDGFCFDGGKPITFKNVDWFECEHWHTREEIETAVRRKIYFNPSARYLVLGDLPQHTFTIGLGR